MSTAITLRISRIPTFITETQFINALKDYIDKNSPSEVGGEKIIIGSSFAPCAISDDRETDSVATVSVRRMPEALRQALAAGGYLDLEVAGESLELFIDKDFIGLTPLNTPAAEVTVDIIAVTGLAGHAFGSWKARGGATMWLRDLLPRSVPTARIMTYGYDSTLLNSESNSSILDFANRFLEALKTARAAKDEMHRPIIFIGYSLGGLVIKQALVDASRGSPADKLILKCSYGLLLFGVPNRGLHIDALRSVVKGQPNSRLVEDLDPESRILRMLHDNFSNCFGFSDSRIISIFETKRTRSVVMTDEGVWKREGPLVQMVSQDSATWFGPSEKRYDQLSIDADHSNITKFGDRSNTDFLAIRQRVLEIVREAPSVVNGRFGLSADRQAQLCDRITALLSPIDFGVDTQYRLWDHCEGTGEWLLSDSTFANWRDIQSSEFLWLHGDPGTGKTYLMSKVLEHIKQHYGSEAAVAFFFCDNKTENSDRRSMPLVVKTIISQLLAHVLPKHPDEVEICLEEFEKFRGKDKMIPWLFRNTLTTIAKHLPRVFFIIDALDECDDVHDLLRFLKDLNTIPTTFQIIISGRSSIGSLLSSLDLSVQSIQITPEHAKGDVEAFIYSKVQKLCIRGLGRNDGATSRLIERCDSLFLLAHFYLESIKELEIHTQGELDKALEALPRDLTKYYDSVLGRIKDLASEKRMLVRKVFMWVIYAKRQLSFTELVEAISVPLESEGSFSSPSQQTNQHTTQRNLDKLCGGLLTFRSQDVLDASKATIGLAHKTVRERVIGFVWDTTPPSPCLSDHNTCNSDIVRVAIAYMYALKGEEADSEKTGRYPLLGYVYSFWILHLLDSDKPTPLLTKDLGRFLDSKECFSWWNSPLSTTLNGTKQARRDLQSRFQSWATNNSDLQRHRYFMTVQQEKKAKFYSEKYGKDDPQTLEVNSNLGETYWHQGLWREAMDIDLEVREACVRTLGEDDPLSLAAAKSLARTYKGQGLWSQAEELQKYVMENCLSILGEEHPDSLKAMSQLATTQKSLLQLPESERLQKRVVEISRRILGEDHPDTLAALADLAKTYKRQKRFEEATELYEQVVATSKIILGEDHPDTLVVTTSLAGMYCLTKRKEKALELQEHTVAVMKRVLGDVHEETLTASSDLAFLYLGHKQTKEALDLTTHILTTRKNTLGQRHPATLFARMNVIGVQMARGSLVKAMYHNYYLNAMLVINTPKYFPKLSDIYQETKAMAWVTMDIGGIKIKIPDYRSYRAPDLLGFTIFGDSYLDSVLYMSA